MSQTDEVICIWPGERQRSGASTDAIAGPSEDIDQPASLIGERRHLLGIEVGERRSGYGTGLRRHPTSFGASLLAAR